MQSIVIIEGAVGMPKPSSGAEDSSIPHEGLVSAALPCGKIHTTLGAPPQKDLLC